MDYTLVHYRAERWEERAYERVHGRLRQRGWPVKGLSFDSELFTRGLVVDTRLGNVVKANRFGFVKRASHGTKMLDFDAQRALYSRVIVDLAEPRWQFLNTYFSLSEVCLYAQLVDLLDEGQLPDAIGYEGLYRLVRELLDEAHMEGALKQEIAEDPDQFVILDEELPLALLDLKHAGKKLMVITNSEWPYTRAMLSYALDRFLPEGMTWRRLFDLVIVQARKPAFFRGGQPAFQVATEDGMLRPVTGPLSWGNVYFGANARLVEALVGRPGEEILYVGDHIYTDVHVSKALLRWRTMLVARELEAELDELERFKDEQAQLEALMNEKEALEYAYAHLRLQRQRYEAHYGPLPVASASALRRRMQELRSALRLIDQRAAPLASKSGQLVNTRWGPLMRAGNDKSHLARQLERHADVYTSRVSNLLMQTPFAYLRSRPGLLPHDPMPSAAATVTNAPIATTEPRRKRSRRKRRAKT